MPVLLTEADVRAVLSMDDLIDAMEAALIQFSTGGVQQPLRAVLEPATGAFLGVMPAVMAHPPAVGTKIVTVYGSNSARGLPTHLATILLQDPETGALEAILDGRYITEARTAAVSAASTWNSSSRMATRRLSGLRDSTASIFFAMPSTLISKSLAVSPLTGRPWRSVTVVAMRTLPASASAQTRRAVAVTTALSCQKRWGRSVAAGQPPPRRRQTVVCRYPVR